MLKKQKKAWIVVGVVAYLCAGIGLGKTSYKIGTKPDEYSYFVRLVFFPATTIFREGIEKLDLNIATAAPLVHSSCNEQRPMSDYSATILLAKSEGSLGKAAYIVGVAIFWFVKFTANVLFLLGALTYGVMALVINFTLGMGMVVISSCLHILRAMWYFVVA